MMIALIVSAVLLILFLIVLIYFYINNNFVMNKFADNNTLTYGVKGSGKDVLTQLVIYKRFKKSKGSNRYFSNIDYGYNYNFIDLLDLELKNNDFKNLIEGKINLIKKVPEHEGADKYITDAGIYMPSHYDYLLDKRYPSLPIRFATSRHLYDESIHLNSQSIKRTWLKIREQADHYFKLRGVIKIGPYLIIKVRYFSEYESAEQNVLPMSKDVSVQNLGLGNKFNKALINQFEAMHGVVRDMNCIINIKHIKYDTRAFHKKFFGITFTDWQEFIKKEFEVTN